MNRSGTFGALEAGGTKFRVGRFTSDLELLDEARFSTEAPDTTLGNVSDFFNGGEPIVALGIGCFGPLDLVADSKGYGSTLKTPKPGWSDIDVLGRLRDAIGVPTVIDSDVGAAATAEAVLGAGVGKPTVCYVTVGTGIGGAVVSRGAVLRGHGHAEFGHIPTDRVAGDTFEGSCPYHGSCLEGMAAGSAIDARRCAGEPNPSAFVASYLAQLVQTLTYTFAPDVISFGGGVFNMEGIVEDVQRAAKERMAGYTTNASVVNDMASYVVGSPLGQDAGFLGAAIAAMQSAGIDLSAIAKR